MKMQMQMQISRSQRLLAVIGIATCFFLGEISGMLACFWNWSSLADFDGSWLLYAFDSFGG